MRFHHVQELQSALIEALQVRGRLSSVDMLLDSGSLRQLAVAKSDDHADAATRDEVEQYERKLRRRGRAAWALAAVTAAAAAVGGWRLWVATQGDNDFSGVEVEPNNSAHEAMALPFGKEVRGRIGRRLDPGRSDHDFYQVDIPADVTQVRLETRALPNFPLCTVLFRGGDSTPLGRYCPGGAGRDLLIPALELLPGPYLVALMQDRERYSASTEPFVLENVSDEYRLELARAEPGPEVEVEPNDSIPDATMLPPGGRVKGRLGWMRDEDVVCCRAGSAAIRFVVEDAKESARPSPAVLQVTMHGGPADGIPVRVYRANADAQTTENAAKSPWSSRVIEPSTGPTPCLTLKLVVDPAAPPSPLRVPPASNEEYEVRVERM